MGEFSSPLSSRLMLLGIHLIECMHLWTWIVHCLLRFLPRKTQSLLFTFHWLTYDITSLNFKEGWEVQFYHTPRRKRNWFFFMSKSNKSRFCPPKHNIWLSALSSCKIHSPCSPGRESKSYHVTVSRSKSRISEWHTFYSYGIPLSLLLIERNWTKKKSPLHSTTHCNRTGTTSPQKILSFGKGKEGRHTDLTGP